MNCRKCDAPVKMIPTLAGWEKTPPTIMPIDFEPVPDGNVIILPAEPVAAIPPRAKTLKKGEAETLPEGTLRYKSHFATCPFAKDFRR